MVINMEINIILQLPRLWRERLFLPFGDLVPSSLFLVLESGQGQSRVSGSNLIPEKDIDNMFR